MANVIYLIAISMFPDFHDLIIFFNTCILTNYIMHYNEIIPMLVLESASQTDHIKICSKET